MKIKRLWYLAGAKRRMLWWRLLNYLDGLAPVFCGRCRKLVVERDTRDVQHTSGAWVTVCTSCYKELYGDQ